MRLAAESNFLKSLKIMSHISFSTIKTYIDNEIEYPFDMPFTTILGGNPSRGAKSPKLWNTAFASFGTNLKMLPMDVSKENLPKILDQLSKNPLFLGGAIAAPHKIAVANWLGDSLTAEAFRIGAVNCIFRNQSGDLVGTNTDGEAARAILTQEFGCIKNRIILVLGGGGAGIAVAAYMSAEDGGAYQTFLACKNNFPSVNKERILRISKVLQWSDISSILPRVNVLINCTTLGSLDFEDESPLSFSQLQQLPDDSIVYDIIYQPKLTKLLILASKRGLRVLNGIGMNLEQAVIGFKYVFQENFGEITLDDIRRSMLTADKI